MRHHVVPGGLFDELALGRGDMAGILASGQRSKRILLLDELLERAAEHDAALCVAAGTAEARATLAAAARRQPNTVDEVLLLPHAGSWVAHCLRVIVAGERLGPADIGHFGALVAAAATCAGEPFDVTAYVRDEALTLPGLGQLRVDAPNGWCRVRSRDGSGVEVHLADSVTALAYDDPRVTEARWRPLRRLRSAAGGVEIAVHLDDLDPYRACGPLRPADRVGGASLREWQWTFDEAWSLLARDHRANAEAIAGGLLTVVPLEPSGLDAELSATCQDAIGAVAMTPPRDALALSLALVHEFQHTKLGALLDLVPMTARQPERRLYSPWRRDPRPLHGLLQGAYAYLGLTAFWATQCTQARLDDPVPAQLEFELALARRQVGRALATALATGCLTPEGRRFVNGMAMGLGPFRRQPVGPRSEASADLAAADHALAWRLRNLVPPPDDVGRWAAAWLAGRRCPPLRPAAARLVDGGGPIASDRRSSLHRRLLAEPVGGREPAEADAADLLLLTRRWGSASDGYARRLADRPDDVSLWAGLALAESYGRGPAAWSFSTCPENVAALHRAIRQRTGGGPDPVGLAKWIAEGDGRR